MQILNRALTLFVTDAPIEQDMLFANIGQTWFHAAPPFAPRRTQVNVDLFAEQESMLSPAVRTSLGVTSVAVPKEGGTEMAQKVTVQLVDDLDGTSSDDITTVNFALDGAEYEIDLTAKNAAKLRNQLGDFVGAARRTGGRVKRGTSPRAGAPSANREQTRAVRDWARQNGFELSDRGRIPSNVIEAFDQAHAGKGKKK